jgi:hypothetical protein
MSPSFEAAASVEQLVIVLRSAQKLKVGDANPLAIHSIVEILKKRQLSITDPDTFCTLVNGVSRVKGHAGFVMSCLDNLKGMTLNPDQLTVIFQSSERVSRYADIKVALQEALEVFQRLQPQFNTTQLSLIDSAIQSIEINCPREAVES